LINYYKIRNQAQWTITLIDDGKRIKKEKAIEKANRIYAISLHDLPKNEDRAVLLTAISLFLLLVLWGFIY